MFRPMRRANREIPEEAAKHLLKQSRRGVLAVNGDDGYPYAVPINYLYDEETQVIIFHGSKVGHKVDALKRSDKVCFTVIGGEQVEPGEPHEGREPLRAGGRRYHAGSIAGQGRGVPEGGGDAGGDGGA